MTTEWTIATLKEFFEREFATHDQRAELKFAALEQRAELKFTARDTALALQAESNKEHFVALNNEAARILKATEITVSRDTWAEYIKNDALWKSNVDKMLPALLTKAEHQVYKEGTEKALNAAKNAETQHEGKTQGQAVTLATVVQVISSLAGIGSLIAVAVLLSRTP